MKAIKQTLSLGLAALLVAAVPLQAAAASPDFARSEEEWARLRDDVIEYDELAGLIHEYNATVQKNQIDFNEFRREYGDSNDKVAQRYRELADEMRRNISYPANGEDDYGSRMASIISMESQIDSYQEQADDAVDDSAIHNLNNTMAEDLLVSLAQTNMISYYKSQHQLEIARLQQEQEQENVQSVTAKRSVGTATDVDVLNAQEKLRATEQTIIEHQAGIENSSQKLRVMLGWKHDATPQIAALPAPDLERLAAMNPAVDKEAALENNYTLRINKRKLENSQSDDTRATLETTIRENEQNIGAALNADYQAVLSAKAAYDLAVAQASLEQNNLQTSARNYQLGTISRIQYVTQEKTTQIARITVQIEELNLLQAMEAYQWDLNGLANAG